MQAQQEKRATVQVLEETTEVPEEHINKFPDLNPDEVDKRASVRLKLTNFSAIRNEPGKLYSEEFPLMGRTWRFLVFPQGNNSPEAFSLYLEHTGPQLPPGHGLCIKLVLALVCEDPTASVHRETQHRYSRTDSDWGFTVFVKKALFYSDEKGKRFLLDDAVTVVVTMFLMHDEYGTLWNNFKDYDSKAMTGHVGLKNQGATCYMNSILQAWFFTPVFRKAVYQIPVAAEDPTKNVTLALQRVFYNLQHSNHPVSTTDLTVSFGWDSIDSFMQHDVQEFNRVLLDSLENKMKGTSVEGTINRIIEGKYKTYIKCIDVDYESSRVETFCDVQLNVKGLRTLEDSFRDYIQVETLDDDNKYMAEGYGLQAARKGVIFESFPPVLHLQLKRFEYDFMRDANVKINDRHEFPLTIDLRPYMSDPATREPQIYHLHGVLVHAGDTHGGHYCAFIRPKPHGEWFKFDDDRVTRCPSREAMEDNFGADPDPAGDGMMPAKPTTRFMRRHTNAYMLVYIREQELHDVLCPVEDSDIPAALRERFEQERVEEEQRRKEREEQHLMMTVRVMTDAQIAANKGLDLTAAVADDATDTDAAMHAFKVKTDMLMSEFRPLVAQKLGVQQQQRLRFWTIIRRQNATFRPEVAVTDEEDEQTLGAILRGNKSMNELQFYVETSPNTTPDKSGHYFPPLAHNDILLFFKAYDPDAALMTYVGSAVVKSSERPLDLVDKLNALAGFPPKTQLRVWEEISSTMIDEVKLKTSFRNADMKTGDILCFMKDAPAEHLATLKLSTPKDYFSFIVRRVVVRFRPRNAPKDAAQEVSLELERTMTYDEVAAALGAKIGHSGDSIRFTQYSSYYEGPAKQELRRELVKNLAEMLARTTNAPDLLYYEKLEMTLAELENKVVLPVYFMNAHMHPEGPHTIMLEKIDTAGAIIEAMKKKQEQLRKEKPAKGGDDTATSSPVSSSDAMAVDAPSIESVTSSSGDAMPVDAAEPPQEGAVDAMQVDPPAVEYRLVEVSGHRHIRVVPETEPVRSLRPMYDELYVQIVPEFEHAMQPGDQKVLVAHFNRDPYSNFGAPFYFIVKKDEKVVDTRKRMQKLLNLSDKEWSKYKMAVVNLLAKHDYLTDDEAILSDREFGSNVFLGLDHVDRSARSSRLYHERTLVIKN